MEEETEKMYLQDIQSYIFDEKKIVTYKWLSSTLDVHVNTAKQLLSTFWENLKEEQKQELKVTYLIGGQLQDDKGCRMWVVDKGAMEKVKSQFKVITSEHIYSISYLQELKAIASIDCLRDDEISRHAAVKCNRSKVREPEKMAILRQDSYIIPDDGKLWPTEAPKKNANSSTAKTAKSEKPNISKMFTAANSKHQEKKSEPSSEVKKEEEKQPPVADPKPVVASTTSSQKPATKSAKPQGNRLAAMFSAAATKPKPVKKEITEDKQSQSSVSTLEEISPLSSQTDSNVEKSKDVKTDSDYGTDQDERKNSAKTPVQKKEQTKKVSTSKKSKQKKRKSEHSNDTAKKRKRIMVLDDSSDDDIFASDEEERERSPSPEPVPEEPEVMEVCVSTKEEEPEPERVKGRVRTRKLVDKTYQDEEGYIVTKKEYVYESCSASEDEEKENQKEAEESKTEKKIAEKKVNEKKIEEKKEEEKEVEEKKENKKKKKKKDASDDEDDAAPKKAAKGGGRKKKVSAPQDTKKQASLMSFFKKS